MQNRPKAGPIELAALQATNPLNAIAAGIRAYDNLPPARAFALGGVIRQGNSFSQDLSSPQPASNPLANSAPVMRDSHGNDMTATNAMKRQLGEAPVGTVSSGNSVKPPARMPNLTTNNTPMNPNMAATINPAQTPSAVDSHGNNMDFTNRMKRQLGEAPVGTPFPGTNPIHAALQTSAAGAAAPAATQPAEPASDSPFSAIKGFANGGKISGPGTPKSDSIQAVVGETGEPIRVSTRERILSASQDKLMEGVARNIGFKNFDAMLEAGTGSPVGPTIRGGRAGAADGAAPNALDELARKDLGAGLTTINLAADNENRARANAISQQIGDGPKVTMLENSGLKESQDLMDKWDRQNQAAEMAKEMGRNPRAANALASLFGASTHAETSALAAQTASRNELAALRGQDLQAETTRRGQDMQARTHAEQLAGNPLDQALKQQSLAATAAQSERINALGTEQDPEKRQALLESVLASQGKTVPQQGDRLTLGERRTNFEIDAARKAVAGLSPEEIRRRTQKQTDTGRENLHFDSAIERAASLANRRKIGDDAEFDARQQPAQSATPPTQDKAADGDVAARFAADPAMKGHRAGAVTANGIEVRDSTGKLIGHYH